ncbi:MAG: VWA domain-containing protein, partial [Chloroflexi bacterium]|nr:VWA domain-containing protein [Chloroflexota bacterium]
PTFALQQAQEGLWVVLVMDTTSSMRIAGLQAAKEAADRFVGSMSSADQVALYEFQEEPKLLVDFTPDHNAVRNAIAQLELVDKWTCLYDAANTAVKKAMEVPRGRRAVVLLTDGKDQREGQPCSRALLDDVIALALQQRVPIYVIGLGPDIDQTVLRRIADKTAGAYWAAPQPRDLSAAYDKVSDVLRSQYVIDFESTQAAGDHALVVRVDYQGHQSLNVGSFMIPAAGTAVPGKATEPAKEEGGLGVLPIALGALVLMAAGAFFALRRNASPQPEPLRAPEPLFQPTGADEGLKASLESSPKAPFQEGATQAVAGTEEETVYVAPLEEEVTQDVSGVDEFQPLATLAVMSSQELPEGESWELYARNVTVGRAADNDIVVPDRPVSRRHAELVYQQSGFVIYDRGSRYGTRVNGETVPPQGIRLADGDQVQLGTSTVLRFGQLRIVHGPPAQPDDSTQEVRPS